VDTNGNVNPTWVNQTAKTGVAPVTTLPVITLQSPENKIYNTNIIPLNFTVTADEPLDTCLLSVDSTPNQTLPNCQNLSVISKEYEPTSGTAAWWHFNGDAADSSGNTNHGTVTGASFVAGKFGSTLYCDGNDYVVVNDSSTLDGFNEITIETWVKPILGARGSIVNKYLYSYTIPINERVYELDISADGHVSFALSSNGTGAGTVWLTSNGTVNNNTWTHIAAATSDGTTMRIFINGEQDPNTAVAPHSIHSSPYNLYIGAWQWSPTDMDTYFNGEIDELRILNRCLSAEQIKSDYALGEGSHSVTVYVNDTAGNWNSSTVGFGIHTYTPPASSSIAGFVTYACNENGLAGATVNLSLSQSGNGNGTPAIKSTVTDSNGSYKFVSLYPGNYNITASRRGFWSNFTPVTVTGAPASESYTPNLALWLKMRPEQ